VRLVIAGAEINCRSIIAARLRVALRPSAAWLPPAVLAAICVVAFWPTVGYPFIQDDWIYLRYNAFHPHGPGFLAGAFTYRGGLFYRPLGELYFGGLYQAFGLNPLGFHAFALLVHFATSLLVVAAGVRLTGSRLVGWVAGGLYAGAAVAAVQPLLWLTGSLDLLAVLLSLTAFLLYARERHVLAALALVGAILCKESALPFVAILPAYHWLCRRERAASGRLASLRWAWPLLAGAAVLVLASGRIDSFLSKPADHAYHVGLSAGELGGTTASYLAWLGRTVVPSADFGLDTAMPPRFTTAELAGFALAVLIALGLAYLVGGSLRRRAAPGPEGLDRRGAGFLLVWVALALAPALVLPNHRYAFYALPALPAFLLLAVGLFAAALRRVVHDRRVAAGALVLCATAVVAAGAEQLWRYEGVISGWTTRQLLRRGLEPFVLGQIEERVERGLRDRYASLPPASALVFEDVDALATHGEGAPQVWYRDRTLLALEARRQAPIEGQVVEAEGARRL